MTDNTQKNPTEGSSGIPAQGSDGVAGSFHAVPVKDAMADGAAADCRENIRKNCMMRKKI